MLFLIPGVGDTLPVNGVAEIVDEPELLAASAVEGKAPRVGIRVTAQQAYTQVRVWAITRSISELSPTVRARSAVSIGDERSATA